LNLRTSMLYPRRKSKVTAKTRTSEREERNTHQLPPTPNNRINPIDRFHINRVAHPCVGDPNGAEEVGPLSGRGLLEGAVGVGAEDAELVMGRDDVGEGEWGRR
jgi:hypothetical protein